MSQREERGAAGGPLKAMLRVAEALCFATCMLQPAIAQISSVAPTFTTRDPAVQTIRSRITQRLSGLPRIDEISPSGMTGLYEVSESEPETDADPAYVQNCATPIERLLAVSWASRIDGGQR